MSTIKLIDKVNGLLKLEGMVAKVQTDSAYRVVDIGSDETCFPCESLEDLARYVGFSAEYLAKNHAGEIGQVAA